jgi:hypothetical protein
MKSWQAEIVRVMDNHLLLNTEHELFPYQTHYGTELDLGHYLVLKMGGIKRQYTNGVVFFGPFVSEAQAKVVLQSSRYLGLLTGNNPDRTFPPQALPARKDANLPILLRPREPHHRVTDGIASYKNH